MEMLSYMIAPGLSKTSEGTVIIKEDVNPELIKMICEVNSADIKLFRSKTRKREVVVSRQIAMYMLKNGTKLSLARIGELIGGKDHATVLHACKIVNDLSDTDKIFKENLNLINKKAPRLICQTIAYK